MEQEDKGQLNGFAWTWPRYALVWRAWFSSWRVWLLSSLALARATFSLLRASLWATWWQKALTLWGVGYGLDWLCHHLPSGLYQSCETVHGWLETLGR